MAGGPPPRKPRPRPRPRTGLLPPERGEERKRRRTLPGPESSPWKGAGGMTRAHRPRRRAARAPPPPSLPRRGKEQESRGVGRRADVAGDGQGRGRPRLLSSPFRGDERGGRRRAGRAGYPPRPPFQGGEEKVGRSNRRPDSSPLKGEERRQRRTLPGPESSPWKGAGGMTRAHRPRRRAARAPPPPSLPPRGKEQESRGVGRRADVAGDGQGRGRAPAFSPPPSGGMRQGAGLTARAPRPKHPASPVGLPVT